MTKLLFILLIINSFIFPATIKYFNIDTTTNGKESSFWGNPVGTNDKIITAKNITIKSMKDNYIVITYDKIKFSGIRRGGFLIMIGSMLQLFNYINSIDETIIALSPDERKKLNYISLLSYFASGISFLSSDIENKTELIIIPCSDVIEIKDNRNRLIQFDCDD